MPAPRVIYGGTFDPVHDGHLAVARAARDRFNATVWLVPANLPPHRAPTAASAADRLAMLQLATARERGLAIDTRELARDGPSWTVDTVEELRRDLGPDAPLIVVIGMDSLRNFRTWHRWQDILATAHLFACTRPGEGVPSASSLGELAQHLVADAASLLTRPGGGILIEATTAVNIAASAIRRRIAAGERAEGVPATVRSYIEHHHLYRAVPEPATPGAPKHE